MLTLEKVYPVPDFDLEGKVVVYKVICPECKWEVVAWSEEVALVSLIEHMRMEHREALITLIKEHPALDQVLIELLTEPPVKFGRQIFKDHLSTWAVPVEEWVKMPDVVNTHP